MKKIISIVFSLFCFLNLMIACHTPSANAGQQVMPSKPASQPDAPAAQTIAKEKCLECHGPFEKLSAAPVTFTSEIKEKVNPHRYVPHNRKDEKSIPECTKCHQTHPIPPESKPNLPKAGGKWCYSCHHMREFTPCSECHPK